MTKNKLTPQEKQMPAVHLPAKIPLMCVFNLFVTAFVNYILWTKDGIAAMIALLVIFVLPAVIGIFAYANCVVRFDKDTVVYRNLFRKIRRCPMHEIRSFAEGRFFASAVTDDISIPVNTRSQNGKWLAQLIEKKLNPDIPEQEELTELKYSKGGYYLLPFMILGVIIFLSIVCDPSENPIEDMVAMGAFFAILIALTIYVCTYIPRKVFFNSTELLCIDAKRKKHHFYWKDLTEFRVVGENIYYTFGTEKFKQSIPLQKSSLNKLRKKAEASIKENLSRHDKQDAETTPILNELAQGLAYIESKYRQKEGKLYNYNILSHTMAYTSHIIASSLLLLVFPVFWISIEPDMRLSMCIIMILLSCIIPADILTLRNLEKMPYFIIYEYVHPLFPATVAYRLSLNFLEKIPIEKQEKYIPLVISKEDRKKYDIPAILEFSRSQSAESSHLKETHTKRK